MSDNKPKDDDKEQLTPTNLDEVHAKAQEEMENLEADENANDNAGDSADDDADSGADDDNAGDSGSGDDDDSGAGDDAGKDDKGGDDAGKPDTKPVPETPKDEADIVRTVQEKIPKVKVKDSEGVEHEFGSTEEIPDDFEPNSYKEFAVATSKLAQREIAVNNEVAKVQNDAELEAARKRVEKIRSEWDADIAKLVKSGDLDKDDDKRAKQVEGVYQVMQQESEAGRPVGSFNQAYEIYSYRQGAKERAERKQQAIDEKKRRGGMVLPGGGANPGKPSAKQGRVIEAPPSGISLDQVHEKVLGSL